jgi:hypothetical protein
VHVLKIFPREIASPSPSLYGSASDSRAQNKRISELMSVIFRSYPHAEIIMRYGERPGILAPTLRDNIFSIALGIKMR